MRIIFFPMSHLAGAALAVTGLIGPAHGQSTPPPAAMDGTRLELQARGWVRAVPDTALVTAGVVTQAADANGALRTNADHMARVLAAMRAAGIADQDVRTDAVTLTPQYRYPANEAPVVTGYQASHMLRISIADVARAGPVIDALVRQGANDINGPNFIISAREPLENQARKEALRLVEARAALYAKAMGLRVRRIVTLSESLEVGPPPIVFAALRATGTDAAAAKTSLSGGEQDVAVTLSATIDLGPLP